MSPQPATASDVFAIAALHARNWQSAYRGDLPDQYLDEECPKERLQTWTERFAEPNPKMHCAVVYDGDQLAGFCCTFEEYDEHGSYLDNLHVAPEYQGYGIGRKLLVDAAKRVVSEEIYLVVLCSNTPALKFYDRLKGRRGFTKTQLLAGLPVEVVSVHWNRRELASLSES